MSRLFRYGAVFLFAIAGILGIASRASAQNSLVLLYDPPTGRMGVQNTTSGTFGLLAFDIITLGNGTLGPVSGQPGNVGFLSGAAANLPAIPFITSNTSAFGYNGLYSQAAATQVSLAQPTFATLAAYGGTWDPAAPQFGAPGSFWDLGNVAVTGLTQTQLRNVLRTDPDNDPTGQTQVGKFLWNEQQGPFKAGDAFAAVPEPSTVALAGVALTLGAAGMRLRRRGSRSRG